MNLNKTKIMWSLVGILVLVLLFVFVSTYINYRGSESPSIDYKERESVSKQDINPDQLPSKFPQDIPFAVDAQVIDNYVFQDDDAGRFQSTRVIRSKKSLESEYLEYLNFFKNSSAWQIESESKLDKVASIIATNGSGKMFFSATENEHSGAVTVNFIYQIGD